MVPHVKIDVEGLRELRSELRRVDAHRELTRVHRELVNRLLVPKAKRAAQQGRANLAGGVTRLGSRGVGTIKGKASQTRAEIAGGGGVAYFAGNEWGSTGRFPQFPPKKDDGYILYPTVFENREEIIQEYWEALDRLVSGAFPQGGIA